MLLLQLKSGEYLTLGDDIVIQVFKESSERVWLAVKAPKDLTVLRGEVLERTGAQRPDCLIEPAVLAMQ